jgi:hypothetical protein
LSTDERLRGGAGFGGISPIKSRMKRAEFAELEAEGWRILGILQVEQSNKK